MPCEGGILAEAEAFLEAVGVPIPEGYTLEWGQVDGGIASADKEVPGDITIDPEDLRDRMGGDPNDPIQVAASVVVCIYHELKHLDGSYGDDMCGEISNQKHTAEKHCELIEFMADEGIPVDELCEFYCDNQECYNDGCTTDGAEAAWADASCGTPYPGDIPECEACP